MAKDLSEFLTVPGSGETSVDRGSATPYDRWRADPTPDNMKAVIDDLAPVINSEIQRFSGPKPLLRSRARALAVRAVRSYDPASGAKLRSWVTTQLMQLSRYNNSLKPVYTPEDVSRKAFTISQRRAEFVDEHGRDPTDSELADSVGISVERLRKIVSKSMSMVNEPSDVDQDGPAQEHVVYRSSPARSAQEAVYASLGKTDRMIFDGRTGMHGAKEMSGTELAKLLNVSPAYVSQRAASIAGDIKRIGGMEDRAQEAYYG